MQRVGDPAQEQECGADGGDAGEGLAEGEFPGQEGRGLGDVFGRGHEDAAEGAVDFAAGAGDAGDDDGDAGGGIFEEEAAGPVGGGGDFFTLVGRRDPLAGGFVGIWREGIDGGAGLESGEEGFLRGRDAVEAGEEDLGREGQVFDKRCEDRFELAGADPVVARAGAVEFSGPEPEMLGVGFLPGGAASGVGVVCGEEGPGFSGERGHGFRRGDGGVVVALDAGPDGAFLERREEKGRVG